MDIFLQQVVNGLTLGSIYAVVALGYTMVYGIIQLINFAHGEVVMVGAMVALATIATLAGSTALPPAVVVFAGVACAVPVCMVLGFVMERVWFDGKVVFAVEGPTSPAKDPWGNTRIGISATTKINRKDFGLVWNAALEAGGILVGDDVTITLDVQFIKA